jgi:hypothetical protein
MATRNTKGLKIYLSIGAAAPTTVVPTAITKAQPAEVTVADVTGMADGQLVKMEATGFDELDGRLFVIDSVNGTANTFELLGSDLSASTGTLGANPKATYYKDSELQALCLSTIGINAETPATVSVGTFCKPDQTVPGTVAGAGTMDLGGYVDTADAGYSLLWDAAADGKTRVLKIVFPDDGTQKGGALVAEGVINSMLLSDIPIDGAAAFSAVFTLSSKPEHRF